MKNSFLISILIFLCTVFSFSLSAQEVADVRSTKYVFELNKIKHQHQVDGVVARAKVIDNVTDCKLDWLNYQMEIIVNEGGNYGSLSVEKIKAILIENNVALVKFTKEINSK